MKRSLFIFAFLFILLGGAFFVLLSSAGPESAPQNVVTVELPDTFEQ
ncbi:MAG: hypothetical protein ACPGVT_00600 [Maricaulaceae bacterium]